jgi:antitoxin PrlF
MAIAQSRLTAQGQISVPAEVRKKLGVGPGSVLEWEEQDDQVVVRRAGRYTSDDIHQALFPQGATKKGPADVKVGVREYIRKRHARR